MNCCDIGPTNGRRTRRRWTAWRNESGPAWRRRTRPGRTHGRRAAGREPAGGRRAAGRKPAGGSVYGSATHEARASRVPAVAGRGGRIAPRPGAVGRRFVAELVPASGPCGRRPDATTPECARFDSQSLRAAATLLSELNLLFDQRLGWVAETDGQVRMSVAERDADRIGESALVVRIAVVRRDAASSVAQVIWSAQLVAGDQHVIRFDDAPTGARAGANLFLWAYALPDGRIAVDSDLALAGPVQVQAESTGLQTDGVPTKVYTMRQGRDQFEVYQTVAVLKGKVS